MKVFGDINTLKYTTCLPLVMYCQKNRPDLLDVITKVSLSFLFRWITIGSYSVGGAKKVFDQVIDNLREGKSNSSALLPFFSHEDKIGDEEFKLSLNHFKVKDNSIAKYIWSKYELDCNNNESVPNYSEIHLEHILPQHPEKWQEIGFVTPEGTTVKDWIYHIGNMTLLNKKQNQKEQNNIFTKKVVSYQGSVFEETRNISSLRDWKVDNITERADRLSDKACEIWPLNIDDI